MNDEKRIPYPLVVLVRHLPDAFLAVALAAITLNDLINQVFGKSMFDSRKALEGLIAPIAIATIWLFWRIIKELDEKVEPLSRLASKSVEILPGEHPFQVSQLLRESRDVDIVTLSGSVVIPLQEEEIIDLLRSPRRYSRIRCLIGNPFSDGIKMRYRSDEPEWKEAGNLAIEQRLCWLFSLWNDLEPDIQKRLEISIYDNYPMLSVFRADNKVYTSYYGFKLRGKDTPCFAGDADSYFGKSALKHFTSLHQNSVTIADWVIKYYRATNEDSRRVLRFRAHYSGVVLVTRDHQYILQKRDDRSGIANPGRISTFGGQALAGESALQTARRELQEETSLDLSSNRFKQVTVFPSRDPLNEHCVVLCSYFVVEGVAPNEVKLNEGGSIHVTTAAEALKNGLLTDDSKRFLEELGGKSD